MVCHGRPVTASMPEAVDCIAVAPHALYGAAHRCMCVGPGCDPKHFQLVQAMLCVGGAFTCITPLL
jgi:hypothetical protein